MRSYLFPFTAGLFVLCCWAGQAAAQVPSPAEKAVPRAHAHNDYAHPHPLLDALHHGFVSVEADIWLVEHELRVCHDSVADWSKVPTLQELYLSPLSRLASAVDNGGIYADGTPIILLVDIKSQGIATYQRLHEILAGYAAASPRFLTTYCKNAASGFDVRPGAVTVIISGNRPREVMRSQEIRYAGYDGRKADIGPDANLDDLPSFVPLISDNWLQFFRGDLAWNGTGPIPEDTKAELDRIVAEVHREGKLLRFWNLPKDAPNVWGALYDAGVDLINTDRLPELSSYLKARQRAESTR